MSLKMIVATGANFEIGVDNKLLWHLPEDMQYFKGQTEYCNVVMGNNTFDSLNLKKGLPNRNNVVLTTKTLQVNKRVRPQYNPRYCAYFTNNFKDVFNCEGTMWIIGGSQIYEQFVDYVDEIHWTQLEKSYPAANKFLSDKTIGVMIKEFDKGTRIKQCYDEKSDTSFTINVLKRIKQST